MRHFSKLCGTKKMACVLSVLLLCCKTIGAYASNGDVFKLEKTNGHYVFDAVINNKVQASFMLESGIHVMLMDSLFAFENEAALHMDFIEAGQNEKMNLGGKSYRITHKAKGKMQLNDYTCYEGEIFVLSDYKACHDIAIPVQNICNNEDGSHIVQLNMKDYVLRVLSRKDLDGESDVDCSVAINYDTYRNMPGIKTDLTFIKEGKKYTLSGNFNLDLGNAEFLFLFEQSSVVQEFLKENPDLKLQKAFNGEGRLVAEVITTEQSVLCGKNFDKQIVGITKMLPRFTTEGAIGLKFFDGSIAVFDFDEGRFRIK